ncbi:MAG TPA: glycosyltransferase, partial [Chroococcales cyanobacterium]
MKSDSIAAGVVSSQSQSTKVLHIITDLESGGAERMLCQLVTHVRDDVEHIVVSLLDEGLFGAIIRKAGVRLHCLRLRRRRISLFSLFRLARLLRQENPDVVQTWMYHSDLAGLLSSFLRFEWRKRVPLVWNIRCSAMKSGYNPPLTALVLRA